MKKTINIVLKVVLSLILLSPILGVIGVFPPPTADLYNTPEAFDFISMLIATKYINFLMVIVFILAFIFLWTKRVALAALILLPITLNIVGFHMFLDGGLFTSGAIMGNVLLLLNAYFLWQQRDRYVPLFRRD